MIKIVGLQIRTNVPMLKYNLRLGEVAWRFIWICTDLRLSAEEIGLNWPEKWDRFNDGKANQIQWPELYLDIYNSPRPVAPY